MNQASDKITTTEAATPAKAGAPKQNGAANAEASVLVRDDGTTIIHHEVVAKIAGTAIREVDGVSGLVPFDTAQTVSNLARRVTGKKMRDLGVSVEVGQVEAAVDARIITRYGESIVRIAEDVREVVIRRIQEMTGLKVVEVNLEIVDVSFDEEAVEEPANERVR